MSRTTIEEQEWEDQCAITYTVNTVWYKCRKCRNILQVEDWQSRILCTTCNTYNNIN